MKPNMDLRFYARGKGVPLWRGRRHTAYTKTRCCNGSENNSAKKSADFKAKVDKICGG